jgi:hypothetical protein
MMRLLHVSSVFALVGACTDRQRAGRPSLAGCLDQPPENLLLRHVSRLFGDDRLTRTVTYVGEKFVRVIGRRTAQIPSAAVAALVAGAGRICFFEMRDAYREIKNPDGTVTTVTDRPTRIISVTANGRTKRVENYVAGPDSLEEFEREIDDAAGTKRWVFIDEGALEDLVRAGWSATTEEGAALLQKAIEGDDVPIARRLIELGADLRSEGQPVATSYFGAVGRDG